MRPASKLLSCLALAAVASAVPIAASAQDYPAKPMRLVVGFSPGGSYDLVGRVLAAKLTSQFDKQVVVENRPGANAIIGTDAVAKSAPDGYTLGLVGVSNVILNPLIYPKAPYTPNDFAPVTTIGVTHQVITIHPSLGSKTLKEFVNFARPKPGQLNFASSGYGGLKHLLVLLFNDVAKTKLVHVAYKGAGPALSDLVGGQVHGAIFDIAGPSAHIRQGRLRALAVTSEKRAASFPEVPTALEQGFRLVSLNWFGVVVPAKTPQPIVDRLYAELAKAVKSPDMQDRFGPIGVEPMTDASPAAFAAFMRDETTRWGPVVKQARLSEDMP